jgi:glucosamine 6-phosphate synthetase-like amidotransferase/phosphosugar isomerase protein
MKAKLYISAREAGHVLIGQTISGMTYDNMAAVRKIRHNRIARAVRMLARIGKIADSLSNSHPLKLINHFLDFTNA